MKTRHSPLAWIAPLLLCTLAASAAQYGDFTYITNNNTITITNYTGPGGDITIPDSINGFPVTSIAQKAFFQSTNLTTITLPDSVTSIDHLAFGGCAKLTSITLPDSVTSIGNVAFWMCRSLTNITLPNSVTTIGNGAFMGCSSLTAIAMDPLNHSYRTLEGVLFNKSLTTLIQYPVGKTNTACTIPESVSSIGDGAFSGCSSLTSLTIPDTVKSIGRAAFSRCASLTRIIISAGVTTIGDGSFAGCTRLTAIEVQPRNSAYIGGEGILFNKDQTTLIQYPPAKTNTAYTIPDSVKSIGNSAFSLCTSLTNITIPNSVKSIGDNTFRDCTSLTSITLPNSVTKIQSSAFSGCTNLASITIPNSVTAIQSSAFYGCTSLTSISIPNSVTAIGKAVFYGCTSLTNVTIPNSVTNLGAYALAFCTSLTKVYFKGNAPSASDDTFHNSLKATVYHLPGTKGWSPTFAGRPTAVRKLSYAPHTLGRLLWPALVGFVLFLWALFILVSKRFHRFRSGGKGPTAKPRATPNGGPTLPLLLILSLLVSFTALRAQAQDFADAQKELLMTGLDRARASRSFARGRTEPAAARNLRCSRHPIGQSGKATQLIHPAWQDHYPRSSSPRIRIAH